MDSRTWLGLHIGREIENSVLVTFCFDAPHLADKLEQMRKGKFAVQYHRCRPGSNRLADRHLLCSDLIKVRWVDRQGTRHEEIVVLEGCSSSGANLFLGVPISQGTAITLCGGNGEFGATVRHCVSGPNGYLAGVDFGEQSQGYVPEHLLDIARLVYSEDPECQGCKSDRDWPLGCTSSAADHQPSPNDEDHD
jgi:hypothetical protein